MQQDTQSINTHSLSSQTRSKCNSTVKWSYMHLHVGLRPSAVLWRRARTNGVDPNINHYPTARRGDADWWGSPSKRWSVWCLGPHWCAVRWGPCVRWHCCDCGASTKHVHKVYKTFYEQNRAKRTKWNIVKKCRLTLIRYISRATLDASGKGLKHFFHFFPYKST